MNNHKTQERPKIHSGNTIIEHKTQGQWKIYLIMVIILIFSKPDSDKKCTMHAKSDKIEIMMGSEADEIVKELFKSLLRRYQEGLKESLDGSNLIFASVDALHYNLNKRGLKRGGSYVNSSEWLKNKKATIACNDKCFQYALRN